MSTGHQRVRGQGGQTLPVADQFQSNYASLLPQAMHVPDNRFKQRSEQPGSRRRPPSQLVNHVAEDTEDLFDAPENVDEAKDDVPSLKAEIEELRKKWQEASGNYAELKNTASHTLDDKHFLSQWNELDILVHDWARTYFGRPLPRSNYLFRVWVNQQPSTALSDRGRYWKDYANSSEHRLLLAQAVLWVFLQDNVFATSERIPSTSLDSSGAYWAKGFQSAIAYMNKHLRPSTEMLRRSRTQEDEARIKNYINWRISNVVYIQKQVGSGHRENENAIRLMDAIKTVLLPYTEKEAFGSRLYKIITAAISLDADMWKQKAYFHVWTLAPVRGIRSYDDTVMDLYPTESLPEDDPNPEVILIISPSLTKYGDSFGEGYSNSTTIKNCVVSCEPAFTSKGKLKSGFFGKTPTQRPATSSGPRSGDILPSQDVQTAKARSRRPSMSTTQQHAVGGPADEGTDVIIHNNKTDPKIHNNAADHMARNDATSRNMSKDTTPEPGTLDSRDTAGSSARASPPKQSLHRSLSKNKPQNLNAYDFV